MKPKTTIKTVIDLLMTALLLVQMGRQFWDDATHEWMATGMFALFLAHHLLNVHWYKMLLKGQYTPYRSALLVGDVLAFAAMLGLMVSGIMLSQHAFAFIPRGGGTAFARTLHMLATYWGFVLMTLHLGLHWHVFTGMIRKSTKTSKLSPVPATVPSIAGIAIAVYGLYVFISRDLLSYMFLQAPFVFLDYDESRIRFYLDYLAMMGFFVWTAHTIAKLLLKRRSPTSVPWRKSDEQETVTP